MASVRRRFVKARSAQAVGVHQVGERVRAGLADQQVAGHPQVHHQRRAVVQPDDEVLAAPAHRLDRPAGQRLLNPGR
jgi:hypothetical protein